jgi:hypothetical protein
MTAQVAVRAPDTGRISLLIRKGMTIPPGEHIDERRRQRLESK